MTAPDTRPDATHSASGKDPDLGPPPGAARPTGTGPQAGTERSAERSTAGEETVLVVAGPITHADVPRLCERVAALLPRADPTAPVTCDVGALGTPDTATIEALARMQLTARRLGHRIRLGRASPALRELLAMAGLDAVLPVQPGRQAEQGEQPVGVEERIERGDPAP